MAQGTLQHGSLARSPTVNTTYPTSPTRRPTLTPSLRRPTLPPDVDPRLMPRSVPNPSHRHGTPSGPWPFLDLHTTINPAEILEPYKKAACAHRTHDDDQHCWCRYPQSLFPNWTPVQQESSRIVRALKNIHGWTIYHLIVSKSGSFKSLEALPGRLREQEAFWADFRSAQEQDYHVHAIFVDNMAGTIMQMLGTKYNIEPFFFSSSFGWIPSRYQENVIPGESDHITITLTFIRCIGDPSNDVLSSTSHDDNATDTSVEPDIIQNHDLIIDTTAPLYLRSNKKILFSDMLSLHLIRNPNTGNTIISYHPPREFRATSAKQLHNRFTLTGRSVYWSKLFSRTNDPTLALVSLLWYALYAWDESLEELYRHIGYLESEVLENNDLDFTQELHAVRANLLHYASLLEDFRKTVQFVLDTPHPALDNPKHFTTEQRVETNKLMKKECTTLLDEIMRLQMARKMQDKRLLNVMNLGFSTVNINDSKRMHALTQAAVQDSAAMKQIAYLTMFFLPATFVATAFGMNVGEINPESRSNLGQYFATAIPLTALTVWIIVALQIHIKDPRKRRGRSRAGGSHDPPIRSPTNNFGNNSGYSDDTTAGPTARGLRRAYTTEDGDIIVVQSQPHHAKNKSTSSSENDNNDDNNYRNEDADDYESDYDDEYDIEGRRHGFRQHLGIWRRLWWPVSLIQTSFEGWRIERRKRQACKTHSRRGTPHSSTPSSAVFGRQSRRETTSSPPAGLEITMPGDPSQGAITPALPQPSIDGSKKGPIGNTVHSVHTDPTASPDPTASTSFSPGRNRKESPASPTTTTVTFAEKSPIR